MGDNGDKLKEEPKEVKQEPQPIQLVITLNPDGQLSLSGPIQNKILCYGLLGRARDAIKDFKGNIIIPPKHGILDFARRK